jgi:hypothetical protein
MLAVTIKDFQELRTVPADTPVHFGKWRISAEDKDGFRKIVVMK